MSAAAPAPRTRKQQPANRPVRKPRVRSYYASKGKSRAEIADTLRHHITYEVIPTAFKPDINRINTGSGERAVIDSILGKSKGHIVIERVEKGKKVRRRVPFGNRYADGEYTPDLTDKDIADESGLVREAIRGAIPALIERGVIARHPEHRYRYKLTPERWPSIKRPVTPRIPGEIHPPGENDEENYSEVSESPGVTRKTAGEETANTRGAATPPVQQAPVQQKLPLVLLEASAREPKAFAKVQVNQPSMVRLKCRNRLQIAVTIGSTITSAGDVILDLSPSEAGSLGEPPDSDPTATRQRHPSQPPRFSLADLTAAVLDYAPSGDDDGIAQLIRQCREIRPDAELDEIAYFVRQKGPRVVKKRRDGESPMGCLIAWVPPCFKGECFEQTRAKFLAERREEEERTRRAALLCETEPWSTAEEMERRTQVAAVDEKIRAAKKDLKAAGTSSLGIERAEKRIAKLKKEREVLAAK